MPKSTQSSARKVPAESQPKDEESSQHDRAPYQKDKDRDPVKSAEQTRDIASKHGAIN